MRILVTGFSPFGDDTVNASLDAVAALGARPPAAVELVCAELPVAFATAPTALVALVALVERHRPDAVLAVGEAGGRRAITPESLAHNRIDARIADNAGARPTGCPVVTGGPPTRACPIPVDPLVEALGAAGLAAHRSEDAGRFVCNQLAYHLYGLPLPGVFVHLPALRPTGRSRVGAETDPGAMTTATGPASPTPTPDSPTPNRPAALTPADLVVGLGVCVDVLARHLAEGSDGP